MSKIKTSALSAAILLALSFGTAAQTPTTPVTSSEETPVSQPTDASMKHAPVPATEIATTTVDSSTEATVDAEADLIAKDAESAESDAQHTPEQAVPALAEIVESEPAAPVESPVVEPEAVQTAATDTSLDSGYSSQDGNGDKLLSKDELAADTTLTSRFDTIDLDKNGFIAYREWELRDQKVLTVEEALAQAPATTAETSSEATVSTSDESTDTTDATVSMEAESETAVEPDSEDTPTAVAADTDSAEAVEEVVDETDSDDESE